MMILLCVPRMTKYVGKISLWNSKRLLKKLRKISRTILPHLSTN